MEDNQISAQEEVSVKMTISEYQQVVNALGEFPMNKVRGLVEKIESQVNT